MNSIILNQEIDYKTTCIHLSTAPELCKKCQYLKEPLVFKTSDPERIARYNDGKDHDKWWRKALEKRMNTINIGCLKPIQLDLSLT